MDNNTYAAAVAYVKKHPTGGTFDYEELNNQPQVEGVTLVGNKSASDLGLIAAPVITGTQIEF